MGTHFRLDPDSSVTSGEFAGDYARKRSPTRLYDPLSGLGRIEINTNQVFCGQGNKNRPADFKNPTDAKTSFAKLPRVLRRLDHYIIWKHGPGHGESDESIVRGRPGSAHHRYRCIVECRRSRSKTNRIAGSVKNADEQPTTRSRQSLERKDKGSGIVHFKTRQLQLEDAPNEFTAPGGRSDGFLRSRCLLGRRS